MLIGYMRVSKADGSQATDLQRDALIAAGVDSAHLYEDQASGKREDRPGLAACLKALRSGDTLVVWKLDRLGRDLRHLINTVHGMTARGVGLKVLTGHGAAPSTPRPPPANWSSASLPRWTLPILRTQSLASHFSLKRLTSYLCEFSPGKRQTVSGIKAPVGFRHICATNLAA